MESVPNTAVITGATAGIGLAFARALAAQGRDLVLVARDASRLSEVARTIPAHSEILVADLSTPVGIAAVEKRVQQPDVLLLVNNAGFGLNSSFLETRIEDEQSLIEVLIVAVMRATHSALPGMVGRGRGGVINVSSVAGWMTSGTYSAAKAWATTFSEALATQLRGSGAHVMSVNPGYVRTEFHDRAGMRTETISGWMWLNADDVAKQALADFERGAAICVPSLRYRLLAVIAQYLPRPLVRKISNYSRRR